MPEIIIKDPGTGKEAPPDPNATPAVRPEHVPEKFWKDGKVDVEGMAKSYAELEKKQGKPADAPKPADSTPIADPKIVVKAVTDAGFDLKELAKEYTDNGGKLTEKTVEALKAKGISKDAVDGYVAGVQARATEIVNEITKAAGGADKLKGIYQWAEANLPKDEIDAYNEIMDVGNKSASKLAFDGLVARFNVANGKEPSLVTAEGEPVQSGAKPFANSAQVVEAMRNPKYETDQEYRDQVKARLAVTTMFGIGK
jgi:hypothetical protein